MDLGLADDIHESFKLFQGRIIEEYEKMVGEFGLRVIDAKFDIDDQQQVVREIATEMLREGRAA
jgi:dTMP kinase